MSIRSLKRWHGLVSLRVNSSCNSPTREGGSAAFTNFHFLAASTAVRLKYLLEVRSSRANQRVAKAGLGPCGRFDPWNQQSPRHKGNGRFLAHPAGHTLRRV